MLKLLSFKLVSVKKKTTAKKKKLHSICTSTTLCL